MEYPSAIKRNKLLVEAVAWMNKENMQIEKNFSKKIHMHDSVFITFIK